jgi:hypothetical protein
MKFLIFISILFSSFNLLGQDFTLNDTSFVVGDLYDIGELDYSMCSYFDKNKVKADSLLHFLQKNNNLNVEVLSHTDHRASASYNLKLSQRRAETIVDYLIEKGIDKERVKAVGKGEAEPLISEKDINEIKDAEQKELAHAKNRRLVMKIVAIN